MGPLSSFLAEENPGSSTLLGGAPSVLTVGGAKAPELELSCSGHCRNKTSPHCTPLLPDVCHPSCLGKDSRNCTVFRCPFILAFPLTCSLASWQPDRKMGHFELTVNKFCGQKPGVQSVKRALPEGRSLDLPQWEGSSPFLSPSRAGSSLGWKVDSAIQPQAWSSSVRWILICPPCVLEA